ncbi:MAG TPA: hypothetical protein VH117_01280 [Edaphobacter sp.]|nr:hypothetical protein [Edaphobacter sp.]
MHFLPASRTKRNLFKIASLGLAGLIAGLLSGCTDSPNTARARYTHLSSDSLSPDASAQAQLSQLPKSIEATQIPALRHPPSSRSLQYGSVRTVSMAPAPNGRNGS